MGKHLFISKDYSEVKELAAFLNDQDVTLIAQSFLHFEPVSFTIQKPFDVIFFSSPRSVLFFKLLHKIPKGTMIACPGNKTAELLKELGHSVAFFGESSGNITETAQAFKTWCANKNVLFPTSDRSLQTVSSLFSDKQKEVVTVYKTRIVSKPLEFCDTYVFTSPSNVEGFLALNELPENANVYSWGESTTAYLTQNNIQVTQTLENASIEDLIKFLK